MDLSLVVTKQSIITCQITTKKIRIFIRFISVCKKNYYFCNLIMIKKIIIMTLFTKKSILLVRKAWSDVTKGFTSLLLLGMFCAGCLTIRESVDIVITLSESSLSFQSSGGLQSFTIESNTINWNIDRTLHGLPFRRLTARTTAP